jgi:hypothetical protein
MIQKLSRSEWKPYFDYISRYIPNHNIGFKNVQIEVGSMDFGDQELTKGILEGFNYDPREDIFYVFTEQMEHLIYHPIEIYIDASIEGLHSLEIIDDEDNTHIVLLRDPLRLPVEARRAVR